MMRIRTSLSSNRHLDKLHRDVLTALDKALEAADPRRIVQQRITLNKKILRVDNLSYHLTRYRRVFVIGGGKASGYMAEEIEKMLGAKINGGIVIIPDYQRPRPRDGRIKYRPGSHPIPSQENIRGVVQMLKLVANPTRDDLVIALLSGGASALVDYPSKGVTLQDDRKATSLLLTSGATIQEINTVRKHISRVNGGRLAQILYPANVLTLIISDVVGDQLDAIGSGPTAPDSTTFNDARQILVRYGLWTRMPSHVRNAIENGIRGVASETPKEGDEVFRLVRNVIVGSNRESCRAAVIHLKTAGYNARILSTQITGEASEVGRIFGSIMTEIRNHQALLSPPAGLISGGETTVTVKGRGKGGRNQELALAAAIAIAGSRDQVVGSLATDGVDGRTDAAGALVDGTTVARGQRLGMNAEEYLRKNDSHRYFSRLGDLIITGPTGTNVNDVVILAAR